MDDLKVGCVQQMLPHFRCRKSWLCNFVVGVNPARVRASFFGAKLLPSCAFLDIMMRSQCACWVYQEASPLCLCFSADRDATPSRPCAVLLLFIVMLLEVFINIAFKNQPQLLQNRPKQLWLMRSLINVSNMCITVMTAIIIKSNVKLIQCFYFK